MKKICKVIGIFVACILALVIAVEIYFKNEIKCKITDVSISNVLEYPGGRMTANDFLKNFAADYGLDNDVKKDIRLEPQKYKIVNIKCDINNSSSFIGVYDIKIKGNIDLNLSKVLVGKIDTVQSDDTPLKIEPKEQDTVKFAFIVKDNRNDEEILQDVQKSKFILNGDCMNIDVIPKK